jgi:periplasmic divalent cation tolerance protein
MTDVVILLTTVPGSDAGEHLARALVEERLAACVNLLPAMTSTYRWQGSIHQEEERQLVIKSTRDRVDAIRARLSSLHPYDVPELLVLPVEQGGDAYLDWVRRETTAAQTER